jgi:hypothetical protein
MKEIGLTKQKMLLIGVAGIFILALVMLGVMFLGQKKKSDKKINNNQKVVSSGKNVNEQNQQPSNTNTKKNDKLVKLEAGKIFGLIIKEETNLAMFYEQQNILTIDPFSGKKNAISKYPFGEVRSWLWSKKADRAIVNDAGDYYIYDLNNNLTNKFRYDIDIAIFNKDGDRVIYKYYNPETHQRRIKIADLKGENGQLVVDNLPYRKVDLNLQPQTNRMCYLPTPDARIKGKLFCLDLDGNNEKDYGGQFGEDYLWSPNGQRILTSFTKEESGNQLVLAVMNKDGGETKGLSFATTVKKCVWSKDNVNVYCAMIGGAPLDVMLPNAWEEQIFNSADTFWKINTKTGEKKRLVELEKIPSAIDAEGLVLDPEEKFLFFRARRDGSLWRLEL